MRTQSGAVDGRYSFASRFEDGKGTNPEELIGAAHAGCYAMAFSLMLSEAGYHVDHVDAEAAVTIEQVDGAPTITTVRLDVTGHVKGIAADEFERMAQEAKAGCPVSRALAGVRIGLDARLAS